MASEDRSCYLEQEEHAPLILSRTDRKPRASIRFVAISIEEREHVVCSSCCLFKHYQTILG
jgi:hypothetical protein